MERTSQNLEFSQKLSTKSELSLLDRSRGMHKCTVIRPICTSAGDVMVAGSIVGDGAAANGVASKHCKMRMSVSAPEDEDEDDEEDDDEDDGDGDTADAEVDADAEMDVDVDGDGDGDGEDGRNEQGGQIVPCANVNIVKKKKRMKGGRCSGNHSAKDICMETTKSKAKYVELNAKLNAELVRYKRELKAYNTTTKDLEDKYHKINFELNEMQEKHERFMANQKVRHSNDTDAYSDSSSCSSSSASLTGSEFALKRKYTQVFHRKSSFVNILRDASPNAQSNEQLTYAYDMAAAAAAAADKAMNGGGTAGAERQRKLRKSASRQPSQVLNAGQMLKRFSKRQISAAAINKENDPAAANGINLYKTLKKTLSNNQKTNMQLLGHNGTFNGGIGGSNINPNPNNNANISVSDLKGLQATVVCLQNEQQQFKNIIQQQQSCLHDYHSRCIKAQRIMHAQQMEIDKLNSNNQQLETDISSGIDKLRLKIDMKLRDVSHLPQMMREEQTKYEKASKENCVLGERLRNLQSEASQLRLKIDELGRRKVATINRLKAAERDLKIFKNYNTALKHEKRKLNEELQKMKMQYENMQNTSKRSMTRQREQNDKQRRDLQKRVFELELKLSRSQNSTTGLIQERDSLIAELQTQLNTLVHNFEVSQKHIRVLRRHIYTLSGGGGAPNCGTGAGGVNALMQGHNRGLTDPL